MDTDFLEGLLGTLPSILPSALLATIEAQRQAMASLDTPSTVSEVALAIDAVEVATVDLHAARAACSELLVEDDQTRIRAMWGSLTQYAQSTRGIETRGDGGRAMSRARLRAEDAVERVNALSARLRTAIARVERLVARLPPADPPVESPAIVLDGAADPGVPPSSSELK